MSNDSDQTWHREAPSGPLPRDRRRWPWFLLIVILAIAGAGGVFAWPQIAQLVPSLGREAPGGELPPDDKETLPDLLAAQQKAEEDLAALRQAIADQQEQLKSVVDQLTALTSKLDALQRPAPVPPVAAEPPRAPIAQAAPSITVVFLL
ncbi:hypothetical protein AS156_00060 [Bradyrhizobium macuxiense]|uniref:Uncharacterized protein n=1 Tax=Bradyrhizobium macuxiense TaxID=1755647 RepID=A0A109K5X2_9BRAD|nr:hypothetical protein [Bradyrhizobium macuxiense]KWV61246.1 hypothetical protein AS156_00060 [Bradyrhizobium macuxiense]